MSDPRKSENPTLHEVMIELISAMSALNMPDPRHCPPDMVQHAYEHLEVAGAMLVEIQAKGGG